MLPNALYMADGVGGYTLIPLASTGMEVVAYTGTTSGAPGTSGAYTEINWANNVGPVLAIQPGYGVAGNTYQSTINWTLYDAP